MIKIIKLFALFALITLPCFAQPIEISTLSELQLVGSNSPGYPSSGNYVLTSDIYASATSSWNGGNGFIPLGLLAGNFTGIFDGGGHIISGLYIDMLGNETGGGIEDTGLFATNSGEIRNVILSNSKICGESNLGSIVGRNKSTGIISNCFVSGEVHSPGDPNKGYPEDKIRFAIGGICGTSEGSVYECGFNGTITTYRGGAIGPYYTGGVVGFVYGGYSPLPYQLNVSSGDITGYNFVGGIIGGINTSYSNFYVLCSKSYSNVEGRLFIGGVVGGANTPGSEATVLISKCSSEGDITSSHSRCGGIIGDFTSGTGPGTRSVEDCYSAANILSENEDNGVGGIVGYGSFFLIKNSYFSGDIDVTSPSPLNNTGPIIGRSWGVTTETCFYDSSTYSGETNGFGTGAITSAMKASSTFTSVGWDFTDIWEIVGSDYPSFQDCELTVDDSSLTRLGSSPIFLLGCDMFDEPEVVAIDFDGVTVDTDDVRVTIQIYTSAWVSLSPPIEDYTWGSYLSSSASFVGGYIRTQYYNGVCGLNYYRINYTYTSGLGKVHNTYRLVYVSDSQSPSITIIGDNPYTVPYYGATYVDQGASYFKDNGCGDGLILQTHHKYSGDPTWLVGSSINTYVSGEHQVRYTCTDLCGKSTTAYRTVIVPSIPAISITPVKRVVSNVSGTTSFSIGTSSYVSWALDSDSGWATPSPTSGSGSRSFSVSYTANTGVARIATIHLHAPTASPPDIFVTVEQGAADALVLYPTSVNVTPLQGSVNFAIQTGASKTWSLVSDSAWAAPTPTSGTGSRNINVAYYENTGVARTAIITVTGVGTIPTTAQFTLNQAVNSSLSVIPLSRTRASSAGNILYTVSCSSDWSISEYPSDYSWLTIEKQLNNTFLAICTENKGPLRTGTIRVTGAGTTVDVVAGQDPVSVVIVKNGYNEMRDCSSTSPYIDLGFSVLLNGVETSCGGSLICTTTGVDDVDLSIPGTYIINYEACSNGVCDTDLREVYVIDNVPPVLSGCPVGGYYGEIECGGVFVSPLSSDDLCEGNLTGEIACIESLNTSVPGEYLFSCTSADSSFNTSSCDFTVIVSNTGTPVISFTEDPINVSCFSGVDWWYGKVSALDSCEGDVSSTIFISDLGGFDSNVGGSYVVEFSAFNSGGVYGSGEVTVNVVSSSTPVITVSDVYVECDYRLSGGLTSSMLSGYVTASDECDGDITDSIVVLDDGGLLMSVAGEYNVLLYVENSGGISDQKYVKVIVHDQSPPFITLYGSTYFELDLFCNFTDPGFYVLDSCDGVITTVIGSSETVCEGEGETGGEEIPDGPYVRISTIDNYLGEEDTIGIKYEAFDSVGNEAEPKIRVVTLMEEEPIGTQSDVVICHNSLLKNGSDYECFTLDYLPMFLSGFDNLINADLIPYRKTFTVLPENFKFSSDLEDYLEDNSEKFLISDRFAFVCPLYASEDREVPQSLYLIFGIIYTGEGLSGEGEIEGELDADTIKGSLCEAYPIGMESSVVRINRIGFDDNGRVFFVIKDLSLGGSGKTSFSEFVYSPDYGELREASTVKNIVSGSFGTTKSGGIGESSEFNVPVKFIDTTVSNLYPVNEWLWDFDDLFSEISTSKETLNIFSWPDSYDVTMSINNLVDSASVTNEIRVGDNAFLYPHYGSITVDCYGKFKCSEGGGYSKYKLGFGKEFSIVGGENSIVKPINEFSNPYKNYSYLVFGNATVSLSSMDSSGFDWVFEERKVKINGEYVEQEGNEFSVAKLEKILIEYYFYTDKILPGECD